MTQAELASKLNINKNYLSHIESGSAEKVMSLPLLIRISKALDIELAVSVDLNDLTNSKNVVREQFKEMKAMFNEMKEFNAELDKMIAGMIIRTVLQKKGYEYETESKIQSGAIMFSRHNVHDVFFCIMPYGVWKKILRTTGYRL